MHIMHPVWYVQIQKAPNGTQVLTRLCSSSIENIFHGIDDDDLYIDNIGALSQYWDSHIKLLDKSQRWLHENGFTIKPLKCEWAVKETDWLGWEWKFVMQ